AEMKTAQIDHLGGAFNSDRLGIVGLDVLDQLLQRFHMMQGRCGESARLVLFRIIAAGHDGEQQLHLIFENELAGSFSLLKIVDRRLHNVSVSGGSGIGCGLHERKAQSSAQERSDVLLEFKVVPDGGQQVGVEYDCKKFEWT